MADRQTGFMESFLQQDERALVDQQRRDAFRGLQGQQFQMGRQAAPLVGAAATAVGGLISGGEGRTRAGVMENLRQGAQLTADKETALAAGLSVEELRGRRQVRENMRKLKLSNSGSFEDRIKMADELIREANQNNAPGLLAEAMAARQAIVKEQKEFDKLSATTKAEQNRAMSEGIGDIWLPGEGDATTGQFHRNEQGVLGVNVANEDGTMKFVPVGQFSMVAPDSFSGEGLDERWRKIVPKAETTKIKNMIVTGQSALRQYRRVLSTIIDMSQEGGVNSVMSTSGGVLSTVDNLARNIQGIVDPILGSWSNYNGTKTKAGEVRKDVVKRGLDATSDFWLDEKGDHILPAALRDASAAAQQHRAMIMELAYLAARMAEPSNRGLSDNDIKNAMQRITGGTSNPQVIMRRFAEMVFDGAAQIDDVLDVWRGTFRDIPSQDFDDFVGGDALKNYKAGLMELSADFGFTINRDGRAEFDRPLDSDVQPGEGVPGLPTAPGANQQALPEEQQLSAEDLDAEIARLEAEVEASGL